MFDVPHVKPKTVIQFAENIDTLECAVNSISRELIDLELKLKKVRISLVEKDNELRDNVGGLSYIVKNKIDKIDAENAAKE